MGFVYVFPVVLALAVSTYLFIFVYKQRSRPEFPALSGRTSPKVSRDSVSNPFVISDVFDLLSLRRFDVGRGNASPQSPNHLMVCSH